MAWGRAAPVVGVVFPNCFSFLLSEELRDQVRETAYRGSEAGGGGGREKCEGEQG